MIHTLTDKELIGELASRHNELIVIRPKASNMAGEDKLLIFCQTNKDGYELTEAARLLHDALIGLIETSTVHDTEPW